MSSAANASRSSAMLSGRRRFQSNPSVVGKTIHYKETPYTVVGVAQAGFKGVEAETSIDVWVPITADADKARLTSAHNHWLRILMRLNPASNAAEVQGTLDGVFRAHVARDVLPSVPPHFKRVLEGAAHQAPPRRFRPVHLGSALRKAPPALDGRRGAGAAHLLRECREPGTGAERRPTTGDHSSARARCEPRAHPQPVVCRKPSVSTLRRRRRSGAGSLGQRRADLAAS